MCGGITQPLGTGQRICKMLTRNDKGSFSWNDFAATAEPRSYHGSWVSPDGLILLGSHDTGVKGRAELVKKDGGEIIFSLIHPNR